MGVFRIIVVGTLNGADEWRNVFTLSASQPGIALDNDIDTYLDTMYSLNFRNVIHTSWTTTRWIYEEPSNGKWEYRKEKAYIRAGGYNGSDMLPQQMACVVIGVTASRRRAKKFLAGIPEAYSNGGVALGTLTTQAQNFGNAWATSQTWQAATVTPGICKPDGSDFIAITAARVDGVLGTQRRRKQGRGS